MAWGRAGWASTKRERTAVSAQREQPCVHSRAFSTRRWGPASAEREQSVHATAILHRYLRPANGSGGPLGPRREALGKAARSEPLERLSFGGPNSEPSDRKLSAGEKEHAQHRGQQSACNHIDIRGALRHLSDLT